MAAHDLHPRHTLKRESQSLFRKIDILQNPWKEKQENCAGKTETKKQTWMKLTTPPVGLNTRVTKMMIDGLKRKVLVNNWRI